MKKTFALLALALLLQTPAFAADPALPNWAIGPFRRPVDAQPVIRPNSNSVFACPMRGTNIYWETLHTFNPAAVVKDGKVQVLYRAEDNTGGVYACGQALFKSEDPTRLTTRLDQPFFKPELAWERTGQYAAGTTFCEGLVLFKGKWLLYYGCADTFVGVATADCLPDQTARQTKSSN